MTAFTFGTCRMRKVPGPQCLTFLHSVPQILYWLDITERRKEHPPDDLRQMVCHDHAHDEAWRYDLRTPAAFVVEVSSLKTVRWRGFVFNLNQPWQDFERDGEKPTLEIATPDELSASVAELHSRLARPVVFVCHQCASNVPNREIIRDVLRSYASGNRRCRFVDPTPIVERYGHTRCLVNTNHWTDFGKEELSALVVKVVESIA